MFKSYSDQYLHDKNKMSFTLIDDQFEETVLTNFFNYRRIYNVADIYSRRSLDVSKNIFLFLLYEGSQFNQDLNSLMYHYNNSQVFEKYQKDIWILYERYNKQKVFL